jgi:predicted Zn-dependent protease
MSPASERRLGDRIARELYRDPDYIDDPIILDYVQSIWRPLLTSARQRGELPGELDSTYAWEIILGRDKSVNAFALPGAYLGVHLGLVAVVANRDELASVLAHELSHVTQRHISRLMTRQGAQAPWVMGSMILGALAASRSPGAANALLMGGQAVAAQTQLNFSRDMEREADRVGFGVMTNAGFESNAFVTMFEKLQQASRLNDSGGFPYLRSHPLTTERMADMQLRAAQMEGKQPNPATLEHAMIAARAKVLSNSQVDALTSMVESAAPVMLAKAATQQQAGAYYGAALAAVKLKDFKAANQNLSKLMELVKSDARAARLATLLGVELALEAGQQNQAQTWMSDIRDNERATVLLRAQVNARANHPEVATQDLQTWLADYPRDAQAWEWLAVAYQAQGRTINAVRAQAEVNISQLDYSTALTRLKAAQDLVRAGRRVDYIDASILDTRTRQVESWVREQALER